MWVRHGRQGYRDPPPGSFEYLLGRAGKRCRECYANRNVREPFPADEIIDRILGRPEAIELELYQEIDGMGSDCRGCQLVGADHMEPHVADGIIAIIRRLKEEGKIDEALRFEGIS